MRRRRGEFCIEARPIQSLRLGAGGAAWPLPFSLFAGQTGPKVKPAFQVFAHGDAQLGEVLGPGALRGGTGLLLCQAAEPTCPEHSGTARPAS